jgi:CHAD domain-containing protein
MPHALDSDIATRPAHSVHDAALTLLDGAIETLKSKCDDEAVHAARKACNHVRAALRLLRECLGPALYRRENQQVRDAAKPLSGVRDAFILRKTLRTLNKPPIAFQRAVDSDYRKERRALAGRGARSALDQLMGTRERLLDLPVIASEAESAISGVRRVYKAGRKAHKNARDGDDEALHEWRKQAKYLRNEFGLLKTVFNAEFNKFYRRANELAEALGDDHDLGVLLSKLRAHEVQDRFLMKNIKKRRRALQERAFRLGRKLYRRSATHIAAAVAAPLLRSNN